MWQATIFWSPSSSSNKSCPQLWVLVGHVILLILHVWHIQDAQPRVLQGGHRTLWQLATAQADTDRHRGARARQGRDDPIFTPFGQLCVIDRDRSNLPDSRHFRDFIVLLPANDHHAPSIRHRVGLSSRRQRKHSCLTAHSLLREVIYLLVFNCS
eukprot:Skav200214  [mRNA]  locus=scaffold714:33102:40614:- [translate_table: standard]